MGKTHLVVTTNCRIGPFQFVFNQAGQCSKHIQVNFPDVPGFVVNNADSAKLVAPGLPDRNTGIEADLRPAGYQWIVAKTRIFAGIFNNKGLFLPDGMVTKREGAMGFTDIQPLLRLKPLALLVHNREQGNLYVVYLPGNTHQAVKPLLGWRIQDAQPGQGGKAAFFDWVHRHQRWAPVIKAYSIVLCSLQWR